MDYPPNTANGNNDYFFRILYCPKRSLSFFRTASRNSGQSRKILDGWQPYPTEITTQAYNRRPSPFQKGSDYWLQKQVWLKLQCSIAADGVRTALSRKPAARRGCGRMMGQTDGWTKDHVIVFSSQQLYMIQAYIAHNSNCQCTWRDVTTLYPPLPPTSQIVTLAWTPTFECDVIYGRPLSETSLSSHSIAVLLTNKLTTTKRNYTEQSCAN